MLNFGNKDFKNLQMQVEDNANEILELKQSLGTALPHPIPGPTGRQGPIGPQGLPGRLTQILTGTRPAITDEGNCYLSYNGDFFKFKNGQWVLEAVLKGQQGPVGAKGERGIQGEVGPEGPIGPQGLPAPIYTVRGRLASIDELPFATTVESNTAYIVGAVNEAATIYGLISPEGQSPYWSNLGLLNATHPATAITYNSLQTPDLQASNVQEAIAILDSRIATNIEDGTGTNAIQMKQDGTSGVFSFTGKNQNATILDPTLTGDIAYGATGNFATVVGGKASAQGKRSMAQGTTTIAKGAYSHAEGDNSVALGGDSHAEGFATVASGTASHSEGNNTIASGELSHAEGFSTRATGQGAHAEGAHTLARGDYSHASGLNTEAGYNGQTVVGHCNDNKETTVFEVGCGWTDDQGTVAQRLNAFEVHRDGHAEVLTVGETENSVVNLGTLNQMYTEINEKLEGKKTTIILSYSWDVNYLKVIAQSGASIKDANGTEISQDIVDGDYDDIELKNFDFNSNANKITAYTYGYYYLFLVPGRYGVIGPAANQYYLIQGIVQDIIEPGSVILVLENDVPDRWLPGFMEGFYALESRKVEVGATNLKNGRATTISVQGGTGSIANYDGDIAFGTGLETISENQAAFGSYNTVDWTYANGRPLLTVGNGTAESRHTAFEVYNNNSIKIGNTILTETQLQRLLALLN